jgi:Holliday junction resolvase RusA-like endonuclease
MSFKKLINVAPVAKPRMTRRDRWAKRDIVVKYYNYKDTVRLLVGDWELPDEFRVIFGIPFPKSYGPRKREELLGKPHRIRPDVDNFLKGLFDVFRVEDGDIWHVEASKIWTSGDGFILIESFDERKEY